MPVCTSCAFPVDHVYTVYASKSNVRLGVCPRCDAFIDPLIEHPPLLLVLDLILLKPRVYLHLLFNRHWPPALADGLQHSGDVAARPTFVARDRRRRVTGELAKLGGATILAETAVRLLPHMIAMDIDAVLVAKTAVAVALELAAQLLTTTALAMAFLWAKGWYPRRPEVPTRDGRQINFLPSMIPLTLLYSTLLPLLLQLVLSIWYDPPTSIHESLPSSLSSLSITSMLSDPPRPIAKALAAAAAHISPYYLDLVKQMETELVLAWTSADRVWVGTRLLGGMSSGFGLRVLLPTRPAETTAVVLAGWGAAALAGRILESS